ncbi:twin transmembrane helix small protein [Parasedimentitalea maritima]|uniref:Twin transmembrane helix small protein n=2 Tax=Parasedimentitalea TaxID=2738399 RepID=A0A6L6WKY2_9RHOB|nr:MULTISPECIES: twin transmembrane helix small protein [Zongyanglinia]KAE9628904.1 twin transmembrane helix small protein [Zongyanglinia marina]MVO17649.1 twin transmembrane helix small protein [Zongyanglinia huanghaiensis]TLP61507.1 twin transmembrane helix small protein [Zongyanglinia marina]
MADPLFYLVVAAIISVVLVLIIGIAGYGKGGEFNAKYSNKMMRLRILLQFIAVLLILAYAYLKGQGGQ